jgi:hypothetical protein
MRLAGLVAGRLTNLPRRVLTKSAPHEPHQRAGSPGRGGVEFASPRPRAAIGQAVPWDRAPTLRSYACVAAHRSRPQPPDHRTLAELTVRAGHSALLDVEPLDLGPGAPATVAPALVAGAMLETSPRFTPVAALDAAVDPSSES